MPDVALSNGQKQSIKAYALRSSTYFKCMLVFLHIGRIKKKHRIILNMLPALVSKVIH